jgi:hypothetical protein
MQTFLSEYTFIDSAKVLDNIRLNKQLLEGRQILEILLEPNLDSNAWKNHPAVLMWKNFEHSLYNYLLEIARECLNRNIKITKNWDTITILRSEYLDNTIPRYPFWMYDTDILTKIINSHRYNLYLKDPVFYNRYSNYNNITIETCCVGCKYFWVSHYYTRNYNKVTKKVL